MKVPPSTTAMLLRLMQLLGMRLVMALDNGLARTPPMGWNPWNCFGVGRTGGCKLPLPWTGGTTVATGGCHNFNESIVMGIAEVMAHRLRPAGYEYISLDCGYSTKRRDSEGNLVVNGSRYPHGMVWLGERIHALGLKFGMYASMGWGQCCSQIDENATDGTGPGCSRGGQCRSDSYYARDANLFKSWGVDYLKFDGCGGPRDSVAAMQQALNATGRDIVYSINSPKAQVNVTNPSYANLWRTTPDTSNTYVSMLNTALINNNATAIVSGAPGAWNDADMLEVGNFFDEYGDAEGRTNFGLWCLMKSPLILGTDLTNMSTSTFRTITNPMALAISKDPRGEQGILRTSSCYHPALHDKEAVDIPCGYMVWSGALANGKAAAALLNLDNEARAVTMQPDELPPRYNARPSLRWNIVEAFSGTAQCRGCSLPQTAKIEPHGIALWILTPEASM